MAFIPDEQFNAPTKTSGFVPDQPEELPQTQKPKSIFKTVGGFLGDITGITGLAKGYGSAFKIAKAGLTGKPIPAPSVTPTQFAGSVGKAGLTAALFAGTGGASLPTQIATQAGIGAGFAGAEALEKGKTPTLGGLAGGAAIGGALPIVGKGIGLAKEAITEMLPRGLIKAYLPSTKDLTQHVLENTKLGFTKTMLNDAKANIKNLSKKVDDILEKTPSTFAKTGTGPYKGQMMNKTNLLKSVAQSYGQTGGGGTITASEVEKIIKKVAPDARGLLSKDSLSLPDANRLRRAVDQALGDKFFLAKHSAFAKEVTGNFNSFLRDLVKSNAPETKPLFDEMSKEISVRNALDKASKKFGKVNLRDLIAIMGGATALATRGPVEALAGGAGMLATERALSSPAVGIGVAKGLSKAGKFVIPRVLKSATKLGIIGGATRSGD